MASRQAMQEVLDWRRRRREMLNTVSPFADARASARRLTVNDREVVVIRRGRPSAPRLAMS